MNQRLPIKAGDMITLICNPNYKGVNRSEVVLKVLRRYDPKTAEGYDRIACKSGIYDCRDGKCHAGNKVYKLQINKD